MRPPTIERPSNQVLLWLGLVLFTTVYYFAYDRLLLTREVQLLETFISSLKAWAIWLLLMPLVLHQTPRWHIGQRASSQTVRSLLLWVALALAVSTAYQAWVFSALPNLGATLWFCYLPANLKILALILTLKLLSPCKPVTVHCHDHRNQSIELDISHITHCTTDGNYLQLHTADQAFITRCTLAAMSQRLQSHGFIQIHRRHLVNTSHIHERRGRRLTLSSGRVLPLGRTFQHRL